MALVGGDRAEVTFTEHVTRRHRPFWVPDRLAPAAGGPVRGAVVLPIWLEWSPAGQVFDMDDPRDRQLVLEAAMRDGQPDDLLRYVDKDDLIAAWPAMVLPPEIRAAWAPLIDRSISES